MPAPHHVQHRCPLAGHPRAAQPRPPPPPPGGPLIPALPARRSPAAPALLPPHAPAPRTTGVSGGDQGRPARPPAPGIPGRPGCPPAAPTMVQMEANLETVIRISIRPAPSSTQSQRRRRQRAGEEGSPAARSHYGPRADPEPPRTHARSLLCRRCRRRRGRSGTPRLGPPSPSLPAARPRLLPGAGRSRCLRARACQRSHPPHTPPSALRSGLR